jgi:hypothetical protein
MPVFCRTRGTAGGQSVRGFSVNIGAEEIGCAATSGGRQRQLFITLLGTNPLY